MPQGYHELQDTRTRKALKHQAAAKKKGNNISNAEIVHMNSVVSGNNRNIAYHGTDNKFSKFDASKVGSAMMGDLYGKGFYFTSEHDMASEFGKYVMKVHLSINHPYIRTKKEIMREMILDLNNEMRETEDFFDDLRLEGYDGIVVTNGTFGGNMKFPTRYEGFTEYVVFKQSQIEVVGYV